MNHRWQEWAPFPGERRRRRCSRCEVWEAVVWMPRRGGGLHGWVKRWFRGPDARTDIKVRWPTCFEPAAVAVERAFFDILDQHKDGGP